MRSVIIVAAGASTRFGENKLDCNLFGTTVLSETLSLFEGLSDEIVVVSNDKPTATNIKWTKGGETRRQSVKNGLALIQGDVVAIHDGDRPFASRTLIERLFSEAEQFGSAVPYALCKQTAFVNGVPTNRDSIKLVQTPQTFSTAKLRTALSNADAMQTDESTAFFDAYGEVHFVQGEASNGKITYRDDLPRFSVGNGFDVHRFKQGKGLTLGVINVPFDKAFEAHSDGDVLLHAIMDAVLSAIGEKDIGHLFPDNDESFAGIDSKLLMRKVCTLAAEKKAEILSISAVIIAQAPKMAPHLDDMINSTAKVCGISPDRINISATTTEHLGALGNGEGIAAQAVVLCAFKR